MYTVWYACCTHKTVHLVQWYIEVGRIIAATSKLLTKITATQNEDAISYHTVRGLYFLAVVFAATIDLYGMTKAVKYVAGGMCIRCLESWVFLIAQ